MTFLSQTTSVFAHPCASNLKSANPSVFFGRLSKCLLTGILAATALAGTANAVPVVIDDFSTPANPQTYIIGLINPDPYLLKQAGGIGGERDLLVDVLGVANSISAVGTVGGGQYQFGTTGSSPSQATLQYDGLDNLDLVGPPAALVDALGLNVDITGGGTNDRVRIEFTNVDAASANTLSVTMTATSAGATATYTGAIPENSNPSNFDVLFSQFAIAGPFNPFAVTSMQFTFNGAGVKDVDFQLDRILAVPEPSAMALLASGSLASLALIRRRRQA